MNNFELVRMYNVLESGIVKGFIWDYLEMASHVEEDQFVPTFKGWDQNPEMDKTTLHLTMECEKKDRHIIIEWYDGEAIVYFEDLTVIQFSKGENNFPLCSQLINWVYSPNISGPVSPEKFESKVREFVPNFRYEPTGVNRVIILVEYMV